MIVKPFRGLRPRRDLSSKIPSLPYDVVSTAEARELAHGDPHSFLHVVRPEIDLDPSVDPYDDRVYAKARENFRSMIDKGWLVRDAEPAFYVYRLTMDGHSQTGIVGASAVDDYLENRIKKHEHTRPVKENDRVRLIDAIAAHPGPVFLIHRPDAALETIVTSVTAADPEVDFRAADGVEHALWVVDGMEVRGRIEEAFGRIPASYVADGHHRAAAGARACNERRKRPSGGESSEHFLTVHFPADQVRVLDYNRVVRDLHGLDPDALLEKAGERGFDVEVGHAERRPPRRGTFGMYLAGRWSLLTARGDIVPDDDPVGRLDVAILADNLLSPVLGIGDPKTDPRIDFVGGIRGMDELERLVDGGGWEVAFAMYPTGLEDVIRVADAGRVMPPKSTWFEPKLRSGMVVQRIDTPDL